MSTRPNIAGQIARRVTDAAGLASLLFGLPLLFSPDRTAQLLLLDLNRRQARRLGYLDLALAAGLLTDNRHRRLWMLTRCLLNAILAAHYRRPARGRPIQSRRRASRALAVLAIADGAASAAVATRWLPQRRTHC